MGNYGKRALKELSEPTENHENASPNLANSVESACALYPFRDTQCAKSETSPQLGGFHGRDLDGGFLKTGYQLSRS